MKTTTYNHAAFIAQQESRRESGEVYQRDVQDLHNSTVAVIEYSTDYDADSSYLGRYTNSFEDWTIDRKEGVLYGDSMKHEYVYKTHSEKQAVERAARRAKRDGFQVDDESDHVADSPIYWNGESFTVVYYGHKIERSDLGCTYDRNESRYWTTDNYTAKDYTDNPEYIDYAIQDYERLEGLNRGDWSYSAISVTVYYKGIEIGGDSCGGFDYDKQADLEKEAQGMIAALDIPALVRAKRSALLSTARELR